MHAKRTNSIQFNFFLIFNLNVERPFWDYEILETLHFTLQIFVTQFKLPIPYFNDINWPFFTSFSLGIVVVAARLVFFSYFIVIDQKYLFINEATGTVFALQCADDMFDKLSKATIQTKILLCQTQIPKWLIKNEFNFNFF